MMRTICTQDLCLFLEVASERGGGRFRSEGREPREHSREREMKRMLDLFCGRLGWSKAFLARGWECVGVDLVRPGNLPEWAMDLQGFEFICCDVLELSQGFMRYGCFDFICASSPCEQFSVHGMKHFHPKPPYPELGIKLFEHTRAICEASGVPYVMENVRAAQQFVGNAKHHCGPFYLWGSAVPPLLTQGIRKGVNVGGHLEFAGLTLEQRRQLRATVPRLSTLKSPKSRANFTAQSATIPPELANCVADYAERLLEQTLMGKPEHLGSGPIPSTHVSENENGESKR
jgi:hypothetical protein